jgi:drug/metabolite transporter (DMT)-like permease
MWLFFMRKELKMMKNSKYALCVFLGGCSYGILSTFVKLAYRSHFTSHQVTGAQYLFGVMVLWVIFLFTKKKALTVKQVIKLLLSGTPFALTSIFYYQSLQTLNASLAIVFLFQFVWIGTLFDLIFFKKRPTQKKLISIAILLVGSLLAASVFGQKSGFSLTGMCWGLFAAFTYTTGMFLSGHVEIEVPAVEKSALLATGGSILIMSLMPPTFVTNTHTLVSLAPYGLILGFFGVALPPLLYAIGIPHVGTGLATILSASELPMATMMSFFVLKESLTPSRWVGVILIMGAIIFGHINKSSRSPLQQSPE